MMTDPPLVAATDDQLAAAVEENLFALFRAMATLPGGQLVEDARLSYHLATPFNPMFKGIWRARLTADEADQAIDETLAWFASQQAPFLFWWTGPQTTPADLGERLIARGLISLEASIEPDSGIASTMLGAPGMVADLHQMSAQALEQVPPGFTIEIVRDEQCLADFKQALVEGYEIPAALAEGWVQATIGFGLGATPWQLYLGRLDGQPVATSMLFNGGGVASLYGVATVPSARRQGIGAAITLQPLLAAREQGYRYAVLFATEMGLSTYQRLGFRLTGARLNRYLWRN